MNWFLAIPLEARLAGLFLLGTFLGSLANWGICRLAWDSRAISPWSRAVPDSPPRRWTDRLPFVGWFGLRREVPLHGPGFWIRPTLVELAAGVGLAAMYWWEVLQQGAQPGLPPGLNLPIAPVLAVHLHARFAAHLVLLWLMLVAALIDLDEKTIPDSITVPGTLLGLVMAAAYPWSMLPVVWIPPGAGATVGFLNLLNVSPPESWPAWLGGFPHGWSLALGLGCWWLWCAGIMPRTWYSRHGWRRALELCIARLRRDPAARVVGVLGLIGSAGIAAVWCGAGLFPWAGLLTALVGMAAAGGLVWLVRIIGRVTLGREAMGFGDVTLMAMIGSFLGWQTSLIIFFAAPLAGAVSGLLMLLLRWGREIPYGPFLCLATALALVFWAPLWAYIEGPFLVLGAFIPGLVLIGLALMALMLSLWRAIRGPG